MNTSSFSIIRAGGAIRACGIAAAAIWAPVAYAQAPAAGDAQRVNVVLYVIDALRADHVGAYGYARGTTPAIDALAKEGVVFEQCYAIAPWALPAAAALLTSTLPCEHEALVEGDHVKSDTASLGQRLMSGGYATALFSSNPFVGDASGLDRGFDSVNLRISIRPRTVRRWLTRGASEPFFVYVHDARAVDPAAAPDDWARLFGGVADRRQTELRKLTSVYRGLVRADFDAQRPLGTTNNSGQQRAVIEELAGYKSDFSVLYDGAVRAADDLLANLIADLKQGGMWDRTALIVTGSHGIEMGEHDGWLFDSSLYEELTRVPLVIRFPGGRHAGARVSAPVTHLDVAPTVLELAGQPKPYAGLRGLSLAPLLSEAAPASAPRLVGVRMDRRTWFRKSDRQRGAQNVAVRDGAWKGVWNVDVDGFELYDLKSDPGEQRDLSASQPELARRLLDFARSQVDGCLSKPAARPSMEVIQQLPQNVRDTLRALGYISEDESKEPPGKNAARPRRAKPGRKAGSHEAEERDAEAGAPGGGADDER